MALFFDTAVQQGPNGAGSVGENTRTHFLSRGVQVAPYDELLRVFVEKCLDRVRRRSPPTEATPGTWKQVGAEWHKFARSVDLYVNIKGRRTAILQDPVLSDVSSA